MANIKNIQEEIDEMTSLGQLVEAYEEIASIRMKKTRDSVLTNRKFLDDINQVFGEVRSSYAREAAVLAKERGFGKGKSITFLAHNGKTVSVLLSASAGLYGEVVNRTFNLFMEEVTKGSTEITIIGRHGLSLFLAEGTKKPYTFFDLADYSVTYTSLIPIIKHIVQYEEIHVFYGKFINVIKQDPTMFSVSADIRLAPKKENLTEYIFEPSLEGILKFFETQIFASLFEQSVRESELAKYASRFLAMDKATSNISEVVNTLNLKKGRVKHSDLNRKQQNSLGSYFFKSNGK